MSLISVLVFPPQDTLAEGRTSSGPTGTLSHYDWALLAESRKRFVNFQRPYSVVFSRNGVRTRYAASARQPILNIHIAVSRHSSLLDKIGRLIAAVPADIPPEEWLDTVLASLQKLEIVQRFSIKKFHQFVLDTLEAHPLAGRWLNSGTTEIDYLALLSSNAEVKRMLNPDPEQDVQPAARTVCGFRISTGPQQKLTNGHLSSWERQDDPYGGLM
ncbi:uncharacterized protein HMPREF1541_06794 [Cyphellophora europaea CBS 101466]|uniref:Uncharacterized protein n=1 Tax=Cyphellophora europaea (strain CBS 101466) TaxID=1220924 RepID=W2RQF3_CYPE1|nr:uncharacterized protein HMPREF1541_06794 [Cyphellophora europaea CBS 101466]ETN38756.1 hypothetical protein HMPREF1541_06794 [Cyphellophora europaea CBS 101466]